MHDMVDYKGLEEATKLSGWKLNLLIAILRIKPIHKVYSRMKNREGTALIEEAYNDLNMTLDVDMQKLAEEIPKEGPFITVSNHHFGFFDGMGILMFMNKIRPGYMVVANFLLEYFIPVRQYFITVNPFESVKNRKMGGTAKSLAHLAKGHGVGIFPAGEVATWYKGKKGIQDRDWLLSSMRLIEQAKVPVIPIYFHGTNRKSFHILGKIHPALRTLRIPAEFLGRKNTITPIKVGKRIEFSELEKFGQDYEAMRNFLQSTTLALADEVDSTHK